MKMPRFATFLLLPLLTTACASQPQATPVAGFGPPRLSSGATTGTSFGSNGFKATSGVSGQNHTEMGQKSGQAYPTGWRGFTGN